MTIDNLRVKWLERADAAKQHGQTKNTERREDALEELYEVEMELFNALRATGLSTQQAENYISGLISPSLKRWEKTDQTEFTEDSAFYANLAHGF